MIAAHLVWGSTLATLRDLELAEQEIFAADLAPDSIASRPADRARAFLRRR
jgi:hypothetical protein